MSLADAAQLADLHRVLSTLIHTFAKDIGARHWGWTGGGVNLPHTFMIPTPKGPLLLGPDDRYDNRWWLAVALLESIPDGTVNISFEFNVPKVEPLPPLSFEFERIGANVIQARHKGWVTVGQRVASSRFFDFYDSAPGPWPVLDTARGKRLCLFTFDLAHMAYPQFYSFACTLSEFSDYMTWYKDDIRNDKA